MARIIGVGSFHPKNKIENSFFGELDIGSDEQWIVERTGIQSRTSVLDPADILALRKGTITLDELREQNRVMPIGEFARQAWLDLQRRNPSAAEVAIDAVFCGTSVPDFDIPANACAVAGTVGLECLSFDVNSACSSFVMNLHVAKSMLDAGQHRACALFVPERYSLRMDFSDRNSCVLFGDGSAAAVLAEDSNLPGFEIIDTYMISAPGKYEIIRIPDGGHFWQNGRAVQKFAVQKTIDAAQEILHRNDFQVSDVTYFIGHQANLRMLHSVCSKLDLREEQHLYNVDTHGNQGAAGAPSVLAKNWSRFKHGDLVVVSVVGSGLTWGAALLKYSDA